MVVVEKASIGSDTPFLNRKLVQDKGVKILTIETEPVLVETEYEGKKSTKLECICITKVTEPKKVKWQMNATTQNFLIDTWGNDTSKWVGKEIEIAIKQAGSASPGVYPSACSLEKILS